MMISEKKMTKPGVRIRVTRTWPGTLFEALPECLYQTIQTETIWR